MIQSVWICISMFNYFLNYKITSLKRTSCLSCPMKCPYVIGIAMQIFRNLQKMTLASKHVTHYGPRSGIPYCKLKAPIEMGFHMRRPWGRSEQPCKIISMFNYFLNYKITSLKRTSCLSCPMKCPYVIGIAMQISLDTGESSHGLNLTGLLRASPGRNERRDGETGSMTWQPLNKCGELSRTKHLVFCSSSNVLI
jgi:hypothetical protein